MNLEERLIAWLEWNQRPCEERDLLDDALEELERLQKLLEPCRMDTDPQYDLGYPKTANDVLSLLSAYIADFLPDDVCPDDEYFGAWERQARKVIGPLMESNATLRGLLREVLDQWSGCASMIDPQSWHEWGMPQLYQEAEAALEGKQ